MQHTIIYQEAGRYAGWPANYGVWAWGDEIVAGFTVGFHNREGGFHTRDRDRPFTTMQARSLDGGQTWQTQPMPARTPGGRGLSADEHMRPDMGAGQVLADEDAPVPCPGSTDFTHPDFALMCARSGLRAGAVSWFYLSTDRCHTWQGPYHLPMFGQLGIAARTDYLLFGPKEALLFLTAAKPNGDEGRVFCARTSDGGQTFQFVSWVCPEQEGFSIMPASVRLANSRILTAARCRNRGRRDLGSEENWIDLYASDDTGHTWQFLNRPVDNTGSGGNPPTLTVLQDGRLCLTYGYRDAPFGIRARLSDSQGQTWSDELVLRSDGGCHDLGYPRTVQRSDGKMVTVYYYNDHPDSERYLAATIWRAES